MKDTDIKATGMTRRVDELGRIVLPIELRRTLGISERDFLEIFVDDSAIILKKYADPDPDACVFCGRLEKDDMEVFHGKNICHTCLRNFREEELDSQCGSD